MGEDKNLGDLIKSFEQERPRVPPTAPAWDLDKVLLYLRSGVFEPLSDKDLHTITKKTLFLVSLATAKRVSELQALSNIVSKKGHDLFLSYTKSFIPKTASDSNLLPRSFRLKSLREFAPGFEEEALLCPVRALSIYMKRVKGFLPRGSSLFVAPKAPSRPISKNSISFFLRKVIIEAQAARNNDPIGIRAHSVRGIATSTAYAHNYSVARILEAATWKSASIFSSCYFRDLEYSLDDLKSLGPFVSAD